MTTHPMNKGAPTPGGTGPALFRARHRLTHKREFDAVYAAKARKSPTGGTMPALPAAAITVFALPNQLGHCRLGLSVGRRVGNAVERNRIKRRLREAFRTARPGWDAQDQSTVHPGAGLDLVVNVRPHPPCSTGQYADMLTWCVAELRALFARRARRHETPQGDTPRTRDAGS